MSAVCHVEVLQRTPMRHPLAHRSGVETLDQILAANRIWRPVSAQGKRALRDAYLAALAHARATGQTEVPLPLLGVDIHPATRRSLVRRGLVGDGRLTVLGVLTVRWAAELPERPVRDVHTTGGRL